MNKFIKKSDYKKLKALQKESDSIKELRQMLFCSNHGHKNIIEFWTLHEKCIDCGEERQTPISIVLSLEEMKKRLYG